MPVQNPREALQPFYLRVLDGHVQLLGLGIKTRRAGGKQHRFHVKCACDTFSKDTAQDSPPTQVDSLNLYGAASLPERFQNSQNLGVLH